MTLKELYRTRAVLPSLLLLMGLAMSFGCDSPQEKTGPHSREIDWDKARWPLDRLRFTSVFAESRHDHFHSGVDLSSYRQNIHPILPGQLLYTWQEGKDPFETPLGMGNWLAIAHGKGFVSMYLHLAPKRKHPSTEIKATSVLGQTGNTGRSSGAHLHVSIANLARGFYKNPLLRLPSVPDEINPTIKKLIINTPSGFSYIEDGDTITMTRPFPISVVIRDQLLQSERHRRLGIYRLKAYINGQLSTNYQFDKIRFRQSQARVQKKEFANIYANGEDYLIARRQLPEGQNTIKVIAQDFAGNQSNKIFQFTIKHYE